MYCILQIWCYLGHSTIWNQGWILSPIISKVWSNPAGNNYSRKRDWLKLNFVRRFFLKFHQNTLYEKPNSSWISRIKLFLRKKHFVTLSVFIPNIEIEFNYQKFSSIYCAKTWWNKYDRPLYYAEIKIQTSSKSSLIILSLIYAYQWNI